MDNETTPRSCVKSLWSESFFKDAKTLGETRQRIEEKWSHNFPNPELSKALSDSIFLISTGKRGSFRYKQKINPQSGRIENIQEQLFSDDLLSRLGSRFKADIDDLHLNFGRSGTCTAFLLRKILEKAIFLVFAQNGFSSKLEDAGGMGKIIGLEAMLDAAAREKIFGIPILIPKTAEKIKGIKFLGDTSAHNPLTGVDMETILPQMPYIITAYKELAERL